MHKTIRRTAALRHGWTLLALALTASIPAAAQPTSWTPVMSSADASFFDYYDGSKTEASGFGLPWTFNLPAATTGCSPSQGCLAACTYPNSAPFFFSSGCVRDDGSPAPNGDCTGTHTQPGPATWTRSTNPYFAVRGLRFHGMFYGSASSSNAQDYVVESVFAHEQPCYAGHAEYGFGRTLGPAGNLGAAGSFFFYWSTNTNCEGGVCRAFEDSVAPTVFPNVGTRDLNFDPNQPYTFEASIVPFNNTLGFHVTVIRDSDGATVFDDTFDPNDTTTTNYPGGTPYPVSTLNGGEALYLTATIVKSNVASTLVASDPALRADAMWIGQ